MIRDFIATVVAGALVGALLGVLAVLLFGGHP